MLAEPPPEFHIDLTYKIKLTITHNRSSCPEVFCKKGVLTNFTKFTGKHLCQSLFFNKVSDLRPAALFKKSMAQVFSCEFCEISKNTFLTEHLWTAASEEKRKKEKRYT